jgi:hypothetical protein
MRTVGTHVREGDYTETQAVPHNSTQHRTSRNLEDYGSSLDVGDITDRETT